MSEHLSIIIAIMLSMLVYHFNDTKLKSLLYGKMMFIETALKNIALNTIMTEIDSSSVYDMYDKAISSYKNAPAGTREDIKK